MKFNTLRSSLVPSGIICYLGLFSSLNLGRAQGSSVEDFNSFPHISLVEFQGLLRSEVNSEIKAIQDEEQNELQKQEVNINNGTLSEKQDHGRYLRKEQVLPKAKDLWNQILQHGWEMSQTTISSNKNKHHHYYNNRQMRKQNLVQQEEGQVNTTIASSTYYPFLVCSHSSLEKSGFQRLEPMLKRTGALFEDASVVLNAPKKTCFYVSLTQKTSQELRESVQSQQNDDEYYTLAPMTDLMKIQDDTMNNISDDSWTVPKNPSPNDWERLIRVGLSGGHRKFLSSKVEVKAVANGIFDDIRSLGQTGARNRRRRLEEGKNSTDKYSKSLSNMFSLSIPRNGVEVGYLRQNKSVQMSTRRLRDWKYALQRGLESDHSCQTMFDTIDVSTHYGNKGFDIILNPRNIDGIENKFNPRGESEINDEDIIENQCSVEDCSASNKYCVVSLVMALSIHPLVISIEAEDPVISSDYESQWITQSGIKGNRPLKDILGIDGTNQIISIIDSGLDINNSYFGPTDIGVFDNWDHFQRKVVRYDHNNGDKTELSGGHGTKVACVAAGISNDFDGVKANGIAEGAKLHIYDISHVNSDKLRFPDVTKLLESMHSTNKDAKIANTSFQTKYRSYPSFCEQIDAALYGNHRGDLFVAGAGNSGLDDNDETSVERTIGNPASCKNTLGVGASHRGLAKHGEEVDYLAAFSSRGPTDDNRMKPDLVAPGAPILTAFAHEYGKIVHVYGTSFAAPVVAGNAALVRQYFEEGNFPCSWANGCNMNPSGSLVKAVLMNSAQNLDAVKVSKPWLEMKALETVNAYDSNQGMGLVQLDKTLPIPGHNVFSALVRNNKVIKDRDVHDIFIRATPGRCFNKPYKHEFSATLTWYDPPGVIGCAKCLINDLDIMVHWITADGTVKYESRVFPNGGTKEDDTNNAERIRFKMTSTRRYRIRIHAANLATAQQNFSFIATGCFRAISNPASS